MRRANFDGKRWLVGVVALAAALLDFAPRAARAQQGVDPAPADEATAPSVDAVEGDDPSVAEPDEAAPQPSKKADAVSPSQAETDAAASKVDPANPKFEGKPDVPAALPTGADKTGVSSQAISVPQGAGKIQGMGESFSAQLSTGIATFGVPFSLPAARGAAQPSLGLSYSSGGGQSVAGMGWSVGVPFIARQTDRGLPNYDDAAAWHPNQDRFVFNGGQELVPICVVGANGSCPGALADEAMPNWAPTWQYFRPRVEGAFLRFFWSADHKTWRVQDKGGVVMELGGTAVETHPTNLTKIFRWNLARQYDQHRDAQGRPLNVVAYQYETFDGMAYLTDIYDTPPALDAGGAPPTEYAHHTRLRYESRPDAPWSYRRGWPTRLSRRLIGVDVTSKPFVGGLAAVGAPRELVRRYHLTYDPTLHVSLLTSVQVEGRCDGPPVPEPLASVTNCPKLPAMSFAYQHVAPFNTNGSPSVADLAGFEGFDERITTMASSPAYSIDEALTDLFDVNSDSLPDVLVTAPSLFGGKHGVFFNGLGPTVNSFAASTIGVMGVNNADANTIKLSNLNVRALDLDGDATIDLVHMPVYKTYSVYTPKQPQAGPWWWVGRSVTTASQQNVKIDFGNDADDIRVMDVNGDGLVDVLHTAGTQYETFYSLGRFANGDGQFGHASWTSATTAAISIDPVTACVPWAGLPVQFSDPEIKLADMNGDGLVDIVRVRKNDMRYWPGRGNGFWGTGALDDCSAGTFGAGRDIAMVTSPNYSDINGDSLRLDDVNGDGLDDLVQVRFNAVDIWLNVDGVSWTPRHIIQGTPPSPSFANRVRLVDVNGSGTRDILWGEASSYKYIDLAGGKRPWVLTQVKNGLGKTTDLEYSTSSALMLAAAKASPPNPWASFAPSPVHVVTKVTEHDNLELVGRPAGEYVTEYSYRNPVYDGIQQEFRGFREAAAKQLGDANSPTSASSSTFLLGECKTGCTTQDRWKDNPREALKGLPVSTEVFDAGAEVTYLSTTHQTYTLRRLYSGLDGRAVYHAFESQSDAFLYDTTPFTALPPPDLYCSGCPSLPEVIVDNDPDTIGDEVAEAGKVPMRGTAPGRVQTHASTTVDVFGNAVSAKAEGCIVGCPNGPDEQITKVTDPARPVGDTTGWLWRTVHSHVTGSNHPDPSDPNELEIRGATTTLYDAIGRPIQTTAELTGTLDLDRHHASSGAVAGAPPGASVDGPVFVSSTVYDELGNVAFQRGAGHRCRSVAYDEAYAGLPMSETIFAGPLPYPPGDPPEEDCGTVELTTSVVEYDRGLGTVIEVADLHNERTRAYYDGFGRITALRKPHPDQPGQLSPKDSIKIEYFLGTPVSRVHTLTQDSKLLTCSPSPCEVTYQEAWAYVDGFGRTIVTLAEADPSAGDDGAWIANGLTEYDNKGAARRAYLAWFYDGAPDAFPLASTPPSPYGRQRYDAFGRQIETYGLDGTIALRSKYHTLSKDLWDAADIGPGPHQGTYASQRSDGHGRTVDLTERVHAGGGIEERHTETTYLPTGEVETLTRSRGADQAMRWMRYDSLGRRVLNVEPHTTKNFTTNTAVDPDIADMDAWRYAYDDAGELVGTSDARGCGANYHYDAAGRLLAEDYSPCVATHAPYSEPDFVAETGIEVLYRYDEPDPDAPVEFQDAALTLGRLVSVSDRAARTVTRFDGRGRVTGVARQVAKPGTPDDAIATRYASHWYQRFALFDSADRPIQESTGAEHLDVLGVEVVDNDPDPPLLQLPTTEARSSVVETQYTARGTVKNVAGSYNTLVAGVDRDADGLVNEITYGDLAATKTGFTYDDRRRLSSVQTWRSVIPGEWSTPGSYLPSPSPAGTPTTFQVMLQDEDFTYDAVDNPTEIRDWRMPEEWPAGAKPVTKKVKYDDLYRVTQVDYQYAAGDDTWVSPFEHENTTADAELDPRRAKPSPQVAFDKRILKQTFQYDWLGNTTKTDDDAHGFYDRSLGAITNDTAAGKPYQLKSASNEAIPGVGSRDGHLDVTYDDAGNLTELIVVRRGTCLGGVCSQRFKYDWDEVGRLVEARRWDFHYLGATPVDTDPTAAHLRYGYDGGDQRVVKTGIDLQNNERHTLYVFASLELRRATWDEGAEEYEQSAMTEVPYLMAHGVRLARVVYEDPGKEVPAHGPLAPTKHVFFELGDHLGSTGVVLDQGTGELVERGTFQAYGGAESDYRPERWKEFREDYRFTGKEEDVEVGIQYFGLRFYAPVLGRWVSADPMTVHTADADQNAYAYVHGSLLRATDPIGLTEDHDQQMSVADDIGASSGTSPVPNDGPAVPSPAPSAQPPSTGTCECADRRCHTGYPSTPARGVSSKVNGQKVVGTALMVVGSAAMPETGPVGAGIFILGAGMVGESEADAPDVILSFSPVVAGGRGGGGRQPLTSEVPPLTSEEAFAAIDRFRAKAKGLEPLGERVPVRGDGLGTVALVEGEKGAPRSFGVNGSLLSEETRQIGRDAFAEMQARGLMADVKQYGRGASQVLTHGEGLALLRAAERGRIGKDVTMFVDRLTCPTCETYLPELMEFLGVQKLDIVMKNGNKLQLTLPK